MIDIAFNAVHKMFGGNKILNGIDFHISSGERVGLVGKNGAGKTTILKIISGTEHCDEGSVMIRKGATIGYLDQIPVVAPDSMVADVLYMAFAEQFEIYEQMKSLESRLAVATDAGEIDRLLVKYGTAQEMYLRSGGLTIDEKVARVCRGLKISDEFLERDFQTLSGGEKTLVVLGKILLQKPDILLLDEPTNHLDFDSVEWLEEYLMRYKGLVLVVSHDRYFLDRVVSTIIDVENGICESYPGNYSEFFAEKTRRIAAQLALYQQQQKTIKQLETAVHNLREWGKNADNNKFFKRAVNIERRIEKMDKVGKPRLSERGMQLNFADSRSQSAEVISLNNLCKCFGDNVVLNGTNLLVRSGERVALLGKNGAGKTTLLKMLVEEQLPDSGEVRVSAPERIYLEQNVLFADPSRTILEEFRDVVTVTDGEARRILAGFMFRGEDVFKKLQGLSGGEKSRLRLCILMQRPVNLLILDEPTNHLDIQSCEVLEKHLDEFQGTIIFTSHDRYFINLLAERVVELRDGKAISYCGNYEYYREKRQLPQPETKKPPTREKFAGREKKTTVSSCSQNSFRQNQLELKIESTEQRLREIVAIMSAFVNDYVELERLCLEKQQCEQQLDCLMSEWLNGSPV
ncbi:MAG: ABC-F family ATP-binding cassette domain-containing protein [Negativicutes bacterium]|jgi:ATPase subunit of ABC transporter with duplicated ATPase domains